MALGRVRQAAERQKGGARFTALLHHIYAIDALRAAFYELERDAAPGVDGETWAHYGQELEAHLAEVSDRVRRGAYRPQPVRRAYVPKRDGQQRPIGVTALEDKIVQRATVAVLNAVYEPEFAGFSYGARPGRSAHHALAALDRGLMSKPIEWVLDADLRNFFGSLDQEKLVAFVERRIGDERVVRLIRRWLAAGVLEDGKWTRSGTGTEQGGSISPLLANVYLHYVGSSTEWMPSVFWKPCGSNSGSMGCTCTRTRRACWSLGGMPRRTGVGVGKGSRRPFSSWGLCTGVDGRAGRAGSWWVGTRLVIAGGLSSRRSKRS
jgi:hypothetical protein